MRTPLTARLLAPGIILAVGLFLPLVSVPVRTGATIWIKRSEESGKEVSVGAATVASASSGRITAGIREIHEKGRPPRILDLAYVRTGSP